MFFPSIKVYSEEKNLRIKATSKLPINSTEQTTSFLHQKHAAQVFAEISISNVYLPEFGEHLVGTEVSKQLRSRKSRPLYCVYCRQLSHPAATKASLQANCIQEMSPCSVTCITFPDLVKHESSS